MIRTILAVLSVLSVAVATDCDTLKGCYLRNLRTGKEIELTGSNSYQLDSGKSNEYSLRCAVNEKDGESDFIKFFYDGKTHDEFGEPRWLDGDSNKGEYIVPVPYLATCGVKQIKIQGHVWSQLCFEKSYTLTAECDDSLTAAPVAKVTAAPTKAPVHTAPTKSPVTTVPTKSPVTAAPTKVPAVSTEPTIAQTTATTATPTPTLAGNDSTESPTSEPSAASIPADDLLTAAPVALPTAAPVAMPVPAVAPVSQQPMAPVVDIVPLKVATLEPTALPTSNNLEPIPPEQLPTQPRSKCNKGFKMVSGYCVRQWCAHDYKCGRGMQRIPGRDCYDDKNDCTCAKGFVKRLGGRRCEMRLSCKFGKNWWGQCKTSSPAGTVQI